MEPKELEGILVSERLQRDIEKAIGHTRPLIFDANRGETHIIPTEITGATVRGIMLIRPVHAVSPQTAADLSGHLQGSFGITLPYAPVEVSGSVGETAVTSYVHPEEKTP